MAAPETAEAREQVAILCRSLASGPSGPEPTLRLPPPLPLVPEEVVVWSTEAPPSAQVIEVSGEDLRAMPGAFGDPVRALQGLPGVGRPVLLEGSVAVRGAEGMSTLFEIDGMPVPYMFHVLLGKSVVNPSLVTGVTFLPGGLPASEGGSTQAVVDLHTLRGSALPQWTVDLNPLDASLAVRAGSERSWFDASARGSWVTAVVAAIARQQADLTLVPSYGDVFGSGGIRLGPRDRLIGVVVASVDQYRGGVSDDQRRQWVLSSDPALVVGSGFLRARFGHVHDAGPLHDTTWFAAGPSLVHNRLAEISTWYRFDGPLASRVETFDWIGRHLDVVRVGDGRIAFGADARGSSGSAVDLSRGYEPVAPPPVPIRGVNAAVFAEASAVRGRFTLEPGVRLDLYQLRGVGTLVPEPRLAVRLALTDDVDLELTGGRSSQLPPTDRAAEAPLATMSRPLVAWQAAGGLVVDRGLLRITSTGFTSTTSGVYVRRTATQIVSDGELWSDRPENRWFQVEGRVVGVESSLAVDSGRPVWGMATATVSRSVRDDHAQVWPADGDTPLALSALAVWEPPRGWQLSARAVLGSGQPYTPAISVALPNQGQWTALPGEPSSARHSPFWQLDLRGEKTWRGPCGSRTVYLDVYNATAARNLFALRYDSTHSEVAGGEYLPIIPMLGFEARRGVCRIDGSRG